MEFVVAMKWPFLILILLAAALIPLRSASRRKALTKFLSDLLRHRDVSLTVGQFALSLSRVEQELAEAAGILDTTLPKARVDVQGEAEGDIHESVALSREAVERIVKYSAELGWNAARLGFPTPPAPTIKWSDTCHPTINLDTSGVAIREADLRAPRSRDTA
ncbi:hypothetical protein [Streptomyces sp. NPDC046909]|uniref:hypothetical protein n=1 Tax=Streptomyces sp. NPDC046909 TaxID=3155617 RepID=UPI0033EF9F36